MRIPQIFALFLAGMVAGCLGPEPPQEPDPGLASAGGQLQRFRDAGVAFPSCPNPFRSPCFEPSVAVVGNRILVTYSNGGPLAASDDGGSTWRSLPAPPLPSVPTTWTSRSDITLQASPDGRLFYSAMIGGPAGAQNVSVAFFFWGIQVASSSDGGQTWTTNAFLSLLGNAMAPGLEADRQWLAFGPDGVVYATYAQYAGRFVRSGHNAGFWVARSADGGATWSPAQTTQTAPDWIPDSGAPIVDAAGRLLVPGWSWPRTSGLPTLMLLASTDGGKTFTWHPVSQDPADAPGMWPSLAQDANGTLHIAWRTQAGQLRVATSHDHGATWTPSQLLSLPDARQVAAPWLVASGKGMQVAWYEEVKGGARLMHATYPPEDSTDPKRVQVATVQAGTPNRSPANTDFAHFALWGDRPVLVWSTSDAVQVAVGV